MKKLLLFLLLFTSSSLLAQTAKILVCAPGDLNAANVILASLQKAYPYKIDVSDTITDAILNYEAVFLILTRDTLTPTNTVTLKHFLRSNNKLYVEYGSFGRAFFRVDSNSFWHYIGIDGAGIDAVSFGIQYVNGVAGTFAEDIHIENKKYTPLDVSFGTWILLGGNVKRILSPLPDPSIDIADTYETDSFKVVLHYPILEEYYYDAFLARVICNYFGLCAPLAVKPNQENTQTTFSLFPNPARDILHIQSNNTSLQSAELISASGSVISKFSLNPDQSIIDLQTLNLASGNYLLRLTSSADSWTEHFILLSK
jgi:hypothetical protein